MKQQHYNFQHHSIHRKTPLKVSQMNLYHCDHVVKHFLNSHTYAKLIFLTKGSCNFYIDHTRFPLAENEILIINQGEFDYSIEPIGKTASIVVVGFEDVDFNLHPDDTSIPYAIFSANDSSNSFFMKQIAKELSEAQMDFNHSCDYYINLIFIALKRQYSIDYRYQSKEKTRKDCEFIRDYLDNHYKESITLDSLSAITKMNKYYLVHLFTNAYGCSPINYLNEKKIDESKVLLETTNHSIAEIAEIIGFSSQSYFSQSFKKHTYMTPNEYRCSTKK